MINETYSAFVQGFMPSLARPDVDHLEGLTTAIIVDQERMGANPRSTVGTATDANAMLRILFSRLGDPYVGPPTAYSFNVPTRKASGMMTTEKGGRTERKIVKQEVYLGGMCPRCEGMGKVNDIDLTALYDDDKSLADGALTVPGYSMDGWYGRLFEGMGLPMDKPIKSLHQEAARDDAVVRADQDQGRGHQPHLQRDHPADPEVDAVQGPRGDAAAHPALRRPGGDLPDLPRLRGHPPHARGAEVEDRRQVDRRPVRDADQRPRRLGARRSRSRRWRRCSRACSTCSTRSPRSAWATSPSTGPPARCRAERRSAPR